MRQQRLAGAKNIGSESSGFIQPHFVPLIRIRSVSIILLIQVKGKIDRVLGFVVEGDVEVSGIHQFGHDAVYRRVEFPHIFNGAGGVGDAIQRILYLLCPLVLGLAGFQFGVTLAQGFQLCDQLGVCFGLVLHITRL